MTETWTVMTPDHRAATAALTSFKDAVREAKALNETKPGHYVANDEGELDWQER